MRRIALAALPLLLLAGLARAVVMDGPTHDGRTVDIDLPVAERKANITSRGLGCCVFRSADHAARWGGVTILYGLPEWMKKNGIPGGGWPDKLDQVVKQRWQEACEEARAAGRPEPPQPVLYQYEGNDLAAVKAVIDSGRMACVTYDGRDGFYQDHIEHMVNAVGFNDRYVVLLDNNRVGENQLVWLTHDEFKSRWIGQGRGRQGWLAALLAPGRAPVPPAIPPPK